ncbi:MAG: sigma-70 family RNA polymerase sigma factor [Bacteroidetes bacterium]|nr:sigma-70 family RNA polymerase sigma factor [Bacteroidota bacterium]
MSSLAIAIPHNQAISFTYTQRRTMLTDLTNEELLLELRQGKEEAFPLVVKRFKSSLFNTVFRYLGNREDAEDIVQDAFVKVYLNVDRYDPAFRASTWIYTIALNLARSAYKRKNRWLVLTSALKRDEDDQDFMETVADWSMSPEFFIDNQHQLDVIEKALGQINPVFREAVILRDMDGLSYEEIAVIMSLNLGTVKSKINRGRALLKQAIMQELKK